MSFRDKKNLGRETMADLSGKIALVTGAASGIGKSCSERLAKAGATVVLTDVQDSVGKAVCAAINQSGGKAIYLHQDVTSEEEWSRLEPKLDLLKSTPAPISLDTKKEDIALKAMEKYSLSLVNSMSGVFSKSALKELLKIAKLKKLDLKFCAGHMYGSPETMQRNPLASKEAVLFVDEFFKTSYSDLVSAGFEREHILLDPGIGFGKTDAANLLLLGETVHWSKVYNLMLGVSRKGIIGRMLSLDLPVDLARERDPGSKMLEFSLALMGAKMIRTHDVRGLVHMRQLARGI